MRTFGRFLRYLFWRLWYLPWSCWKGDFAAYLKRLERARLPCWPVWSTRCGISPGCLTRRWCLRGGKSSRRLDGRNRSPQVTKASY